MRLEEVDLCSVGRSSDGKPSKSSREEAGQKLHRGELRGMKRV